MALGCEVLPNGAPDPSFTQPEAVEVIESVGAITTFSLLYNVTINDGDYPLLADDKIGPEADLAIRVVDGEATTILVNGPVTRHRASIVQGGDRSTLEVVGGDVTLKMGRESVVKVWSDTTDEAAITQMLTEAAITPKSVALPSSVVHTERKNALVQREPNLHLIRRLARRNGCWFWLEYDATTALPSAHVERPPIDQPADIEFFVEGSSRNIDDVVIDWDVERVVSADSSGRDPFAGSDMDGSADKSPLGPLANLAFGDIATASRRARLTVPVDDAGDLIVRSEAALIEQGWFVSATLNVRAKRLKRVVRSPSVVALHGVGRRHSGKYIVGRVVHRIDDDDHLMTVTLIRNGWN